MYVRMYVDEKVNDSLQVDIVNEFIYLGYAFINENDVDLEVRCGNTLCKTNKHVVKKAIKKASKQ